MTILWLQAFELFDEDGSGKITLRVSLAECLWV